MSNSRSARLERDVIDIKTFPYLCFVRFDLVHKEFDREFNIHFDEHIQELANRPGYSTAWRTKELRGAGNEGVMEQEYQQIYAEGRAACPAARPTAFRQGSRDPRSPPKAPLGAWQTGGPSTSRRAGR